VQGGKADVVELLLDAGAAVDERVDGKTPLHFAKCDRTASATGIAKLLLANGADPNARNDDGETPEDCERSRVRLQFALDGCKCTYLRHSAPPTSCADVRCVRIP